MYKLGLSSRHVLNYNRKLLPCLTSNESSQLYSSNAPAAYTTDINQLKSKYDVVIIGAGHNGLVAANYLAKFSKKKLKICLLERRHCVGGAAVTEEIVPGFKFSRASYLFSLFRPIILKDLDLMRHNMLKFYLRNPSSYTPLLDTDPQWRKDRTSLTLSADPKFNTQQIAKFSLKDAENYEKYEDWLQEICNGLEGYMDLPPPSIKSFHQQKSTLSKLKYIKSYINDMKQAKFFGHNYEDIYRLMTEPASNLLDEWFESDVLKGTLATDSVIGANLSPYSIGSAYVLLHHVIGGVDGKKGAWAYVEGGMGAVSECLAYNCKSFEGQIDIFVSQEVKHIELNQSNTKAAGVVLADGKFIESDFVLSNATPHVTFQKLMSRFDFENHDNEEIAKFFKRVDKIDYDSGTMKINLAVNKLPNFLANPNFEENVAMPHHQTTIHLNAENMQMTDTAFLDMNVKKQPSEKPLIEMVIPSSLDPTLAPKDHHVILLFCQYFPMNRSQKSSEYKDKYAKLVFDSIEKYAPGFTDSIIGKDILTPADLEAEFGLTGGNIFHGAMPLNQLFINRPVAQNSTYSTPINGLYLTGSGAHPGGGVMGGPGRLGAIEVLKYMNS